MIPSWWHYMLSGALGSFVVVGARWSLTRRPVRRLYYRWRLRVWTRRLELYRRTWHRVEQRTALGLELPVLNSTPEFWERQVTRAMLKRTELRRKLSALGGRKAS